MNEEEKKAVKYFYNLRATIDESNMLFDEEINVKHGKETIKQITIILNLLEKLQKENEYLQYKLREKISVEAHEQVEQNYIAKNIIKDKIRKNEEIIDITNDGDLIHELFQKNKVYEELLESEV